MWRNVGWNEKLLRVDEFQLYPQYLWQQSVSLSLLSFLLEVLGLLEMLLTLLPDANYIFSGLGWVFVYLNVVQMLSFILATWELRLFYSMGVGCYYYCRCWLSSYVWVLHKIIHYKRVEVRKHSNWTALIAMIISTAMLFYKIRVARSSELLSMKTEVVIQLQIVSHQYQHS